MAEHTLFYAQRPRFEPPVKTWVSVWESFRSSAAVVLTLSLSDSYPVLKKKEKSYRQC